MRTIFGQGPTAKMVRNSGPYEGAPFAARRSWISFTIT